MLNALKKPWTRQDPRREQQIKILSDFKLGYPNLATFKNSSEAFSIYRRFGYLQSRLLLEKQDVLRVLEQRLDQYDREHATTSYTRTLSADELMPRQSLLEEIENAFNSYATVLKSSQQLLAINRPTDPEYRSVQTYISNNNPLHATEQDYIRHKHDLITLRPGRDHAWLDRTIDRSLQILHKPFPFLNRIFCSPEDALKSRSGDEVYYTQSRIDLCASSLITFMIVALLIVPIYLLYNLVKDTDGKLDDHATGVCIAILLVCTLLFSAVLSVFTRAKRHEILGAAAASFRKYQTQTPPITSTLTTEVSDAETIDHTPADLEEPRYACQDVLGTTELLEHTISFLPMKKIFAVQRVFKQWRDVIATSPSIEEKMFMRLKTTPKGTCDPRLMGWPYRALQRLGRSVPSKFTLVSFNPELLRHDGMCTTRCFGLNCARHGTRVMVRWRPASIKQCHSLFDTSISDPPCKIAEVCMKVRFRKEACSAPNSAPEYPIKFWVSGITANSESGLTFQDVLRAALNARIGIKCKDDFNFPSKPEHPSELSTLRYKTFMGSQRIAAGNHW
ncbi:hypothetical protein MBLNU13_g09592t1 [Cladosporium sp. NU13]